MFETTLKEISNSITFYKNSNKSMFVSSSFQTYSVPLLHIISSIDRSIPIIFLNTGFHFPETIVFKNELEQKLGLNIIEIESEIPKISQINDSGTFHYVNNPQFCCQLNKVMPMDEVIKEYDVWINGVRKDQNANRAKMPIKMKIRHNTERYHPMLNWTSKMIWNYIKQFNLPKHPLESKGYLSIGCEPCTSKFFEEEIETLRTTSRWEGMKKTECGLHTDLAK